MKNWTFKNIVCILIITNGIGCELAVHQRYINSSIVTTIISFDSIELSFINNHQSLKLFSLADSTTREDDISELADSLRSQFKGSQNSIVGKLFARQLYENNPIYTGRGTNEVTRLRAYLLYTWGEIKLTKDAFPIVMGELSHGKDSYLLAATVRIASQLEEEAPHILPLLIRLLGSDYKDDLISFSKYKFDYPLKNPTSLKLEIIKSLSVLKGLETEKLELLKSISRNENTMFYSQAIKEAARKTYKKIVSDTTFIYQKLESSLIPINHNIDFTTSWIPIKEREENILSYIRFQDHFGGEFDFGELKGKPSALTFFYSSCSNPYKCSETIFRLAELQKEIFKTSLRNKVNILAITVDPIYDTPSILINYGEARGLVLSKKMKPNTVFLRAANSQNRKLLKNLNVNINFGMEQVSLHRVEMILLDKEGKIAKKYIHTIWQNENLIQDLKFLIKEI